MSQKSQVSQLSQVSSSFDQEQPQLTTNQPHYYFNPQYCASAQNSSPNSGQNSGQNQGGDGGSPKGVQNWRSLRAVMAYYCTLRRIKRNGAKLHF